MIQKIASIFLKVAGSLLLGGTILWQVVEHTGPPRGRAIVHVSNLHVNLDIDHTNYRVEDFSETPVVCELPPGRHMARMSRNGKVLAEQQFQVVAGEEIVLAVWDRNAPGRKIPSSPPRIAHRLMRQPAGPERAGPTRPAWVLEPSRSPL